MKTLTGTDIDRAKALLEAGELCAIPTETVYGLAANALDARAVARIFEAKDRPFFDPLIVHVAHLDILSNYVVEFPEWAAQLAAAFMPGPLTLVLEKREEIPDIVTAGSATVALRIPRHPLAMKLLQTLDFPLAAPSANPFGYISPTTSQHVYDQLAGKIPYILDGGECNVGIESTIVGERDGKPAILRLGGTSAEDIWNVIGTCEIVRNSATGPINPGALEHHYAPRHTLLLDFDTLDDYPPEKIGIISFEKEYAGIPAGNQYILSPNGDLTEAAQRIFSAMRALDAKEIDIIFAEHFPETGLGRAINDRLRRAAG